MDSNISNSSELFKEINTINVQKNDNNYQYKEYKKEEDDLKNLRIQNSLSLRKKKLNDYLISKRKIDINKESNNEEDIYIDIKKIEYNIPQQIVKEFDTYEDKLSIMHKFLTNDFSLLNGMKFVEENLKQFIIYKLNKYSFEGNTDIFEDKFKNNLILVFYDIIKILNEYNDKAMLFGTTTILVNISFNSDIVIKEIRKANIWKRLEEITELKNSEINDNIMQMLLNLYSSDNTFGKEYILSNYSKYIKQIIINYFKTFIEDSKKDNINLNLYISGIYLIKKLIKQENKEINKNIDLDVVVKMKFIYDYLTKMFIILVSWILNKVENPKHEYIFRLISILINGFCVILTYLDEETYQMQEFRGESFVSSFCSFLKFLIFNNEKKISVEIIEDILKELYNFIGIFFSYNFDITDIYSKNKIIVITEELIKDILLMSPELANRIIFFLSNYGDTESRNKEIYEESDIIMYIKDFSRKNIYDDKTCYNVFCLLENGFLYGNYNCRDIIINNFCYFLVERVKILSDLVNQKQQPNHIKFFVDKCKLLTLFISFLRSSEFTKLQILKNLLDYIRFSNIEQIATNSLLIIKDEKQNNIIELFINAIK